MKSTKKKIIIGICVSLILLMLAGSFFAIIYRGIVQTVSDAIGNVIEGVDDLWDWVRNVPRNIVNWVNEVLDLKSFDEPESEVITIVLPDTYITEIKDGLENKGINLEAAGFKDLELNKMVLTTFKTFATDETEVAMLISEEQYKSGDLKDENKGETFYRMEMEGSYYIATKGIVNLQIEVDGKKENMYCYTENSFQKLKDIYNKAVEDNKKDFANAIKKHLKKSYTIKSIGSVEILAQEEKEDIKFETMIYESSSDVAKKYENAGVINYSEENSSLGTTKVQYSENITEYTMPLEFLSTILEITASSDFALEICDLVADSSITAVMYPETVIEEKVTEKKYNADVDINLCEEIDSDIEETKEISDSEVTSVLVERTEKETHNVVVTDVDTWWCKISANVQSSTEEYFVGVDENGDMFESKEDLENLWTNGSADSISANIGTTWNTYKDRDKKQTDNTDISDIFNQFFDYDYKDYWIDDTLEEKTTIENTLLEKILTVEYDGYADKIGLDEKEGKYIVENISLNPSNVLTREYTTTKTTRHTVGVVEKEDKTEKFLNLLRNSNGEDITYHDLYCGDTECDGDDATVGKLLLNGSEMLFEILEHYPNSRNTSYIMRYILYLYSTEENFGITSFEELLEIFGNMKPMGGQNSTALLIEYIHSWEGTPKTNADGTKYIVFDDGYGNPTVGWGVDINSHIDLFEDYNTSIGSEIDINFVDAIEESEIDSNIETIKSASSGLNLTDYQINALVSRAYNCGTGSLTSSEYPGAIGIRNGKNFVQAYNAYWNQETDDLFDGKNTDADYTHSLYTQYMAKPTTSGGQYSKGLENRRKSEWTVFQVGYYDRIDKWHTSSSDLLTDLLIAADEVHLEEITWTYSTGGDLYWNNIEMSINNPNKVTCCATYVSCVLYRAGIFTESEMNSSCTNYNYCPTLSEFLRNNGWIKITSYSDLEPGDIVFMNYNNGGNNEDHVQIYAGDGTWYNAGSTDAIQRSSPYSQGSWAADNFYYAYRQN